MLIDLVADTAHSVLQEEIDLIARLVARRQRFENWLQLEIYKRLTRSDPDIEIDVERPYPMGQERCDFWCREADERESWVELKLCVTNYAQDYTGQTSPRPITNQVASVITDIERLRRLPVAACFRQVLLLAYPMPVCETPHAEWTRHLDKIKQSSASVVDGFTVRFERAGKSAMLIGYKISA